MIKEKDLLLISEEIYQKFMNCSQVKVIQEPNRDGAWTFDAQHPGTGAFIELTWQDPRYNYDPDFHFLLFFIFSDI